MPKVDVALPSGEVGSVDEDDVQHVIDSGGQVVTPETEHKAAVANKFGGIYNEAKATALGAARGATLGLSDVAAVHGANLLGGTSAKQAVQDYLAGQEEAHGSLSGAGEFVGAALPALLTGGGSAAAEGGSALARLGVAAGRDAAIGGAYGLGGALSQASIHDNPLTAEYLLSETAKGALFGGAAGAAIHGAGSLFSRATRGSLDSAASKLAGGEVRGVAGELSAMPNVTDEAVMAAGGEPRSEIDRRVREMIDFRFKNDPESRMKATHVWEHREEGFKKSAAEADADALTLKDSLTEAEAARRKVELASFGQAKTEQMAEKVDPTLHREALHQARDIQDQAKQMMDYIEQDPSKGGIGSQLNKFKKEAFHGFSQRLDAAVDGSEKLRAGRIFNALDQFKRDVGKMAQFGKGDFATPGGARMFDEFYHNSVMPALEDTRIFGEAGTAQKEINEVISKRLATADQFRSKFMRQVGNDKGRPIYGADSSAVVSHLNGVGKVANLSNEELMANEVKHSLDEIKVLQKHYQYGSAESKALEDAKAQYAKVQSTIEKAHVDARTRNYINDLRGAEQQGAVSSTLSGAVLGHIGGPVGSALGAAVGAARGAWNNPVGMLEKFARLESGTNGVAGKITNGVASMFHVPRTALLRPAQFLGALSEKAGRTAAFDAIPQLDKEENSESQIPAITARAHEHVADFSSIAPNMATSYINGTNKAATYLTQNAPKPYVDPHSLTQKADPKVYNPEDIRVYNVRKDAVTNPVGVLQTMKQGALQPEHVEALQAVYPQMYQQMVTQMVEHISTYQPDLDFGQKAQLSTFLQRPIDQLLDPAFIGELQKTVAQAQGGGNKGTKTNATAKPQGAIHMTPSQSEINTSDYETDSSADYGEDD